MQYFNLHLVHGLFLLFIYSNGGECNWDGVKPNRLNVDKKFNSKRKT
jgi:hypothetical protein